MQAEIRENTAIKESSSTIHRLTLVEMHAFNRSTKSGGSLRFVRLPCRSTNTPATSVLAPRIPSVT
jgi:hypothetical protein